eukprot:Em0025g43a
MTDLPESWGSEQPTSDGQSFKPVTRRAVIGDIAIWAECYTLMASVLARKYPASAPDLFLSIETVAHTVSLLGTGAMMAKIDIEAAYRLLPVHPQDRLLLGIEWNGEVFCDAMLPFGLRSAPKIFNAVADGLEWILQRIEVDSVSGTLRLPADKLRRLLSTLHSWGDRKSDQGRGTQFSTDASGSWGCGAWCGPKWFQVKWGSRMSAIPIAVKELIPIILAAAIWGQCWKGLVVTCHCDNVVAVSAVQFRSCRQQHIMHLLRCLFFVEARFDFQLRCVHIPGYQNDCADDLSRNHLPSFFAKVTGAHPLPSPVPPTAVPSPTNSAGAACIAGIGFPLAEVEQSVRRYFQSGLAITTQRTYSSGAQRFLPFFCAGMLERPIRFESAGERMGHAKVKDEQFRVIEDVVRGRDTFVSVPTWVQAGIQRLQGHDQTVKRRIRLPITTAILEKLRQHWDQRVGVDKYLLWAVAALCFFGFFRLGELLIASSASEEESTHLRLSWGDVAIDNASAPTMLRVFLRVSKSDQMGRGAYVFVGRTSNSLCPVAAVLAYMTKRGTLHGQFFCDQQGKPLCKVRYVAELKRALSAVGVDQSLYAGHSFRIGAATAAAMAGMEEATIRTLGRWNSDAFMLYIRMPGSQLAKLTNTIAGGCQIMPRP